MAARTSAAAGPASRGAAPATSVRPLGRSLAKLRDDSILQSLTTAVVVLGRDLTIAFLNSAAESLLGTSQRQAYGRALADLVLPPDELVGLCRKALDSGLTYGCRDLAARVAERELMLDCRVGVLDTDPDYLLLELFDTEVERQLRREEDLLAQQRLSRRIIRQLAHEVKNPLGGLRGAAQLLERQLPSTDLKAYTRVIIEEADRLAALVDGILRAGGQPRVSEINLHEVTEHVAQRGLRSAERPHRRRGGCITTRGASRRRSLRGHRQRGTRQLRFGLLGLRMLVCCTMKLTGSERSTSSPLASRITA